MAGSTPHPSEIRTIFIAIEFQNSFFAVGPLPNTHQLFLRKEFVHASGPSLPISLLLPGGVGRQASKRVMPDLVVPVKQKVEETRRGLASPSSVTDTADAAVGDLFIHHSKYGNAKIGVFRWPARFKASRQKKRQVRLSAFSIVYSPQK